MQLKCDKADGVMFFDDRRTEGDGVRPSQPRSNVGLVGRGRIVSQSGVFDGGRQSAGPCRGDVVAQGRSSRARRSSASRHPTAGQNARRTLYVQRH